MATDQLRNSEMTVRELAEAWKSSRSVFASPPSIINIPYIVDRRGPKERRLVQIYWIGGGQVRLRWGRKRCGRHSEGYVGLWSVAARRSHADSALLTRGRTEG